jgi:hypothetical protein
MAVSGAAARSASVFPRASGATGATRGLEIEVTAHVWGARHLGESGGRRLWRRLLVGSRRRAHVGLQHLRDFVCGFLPVLEIRDFAILLLHLALVLRISVVLGLAAGRRLLRSDFGIIRARRLRVGWDVGDGV